MATNGIGCSSGEIQWQYFMHGNWRTLSENNNRVINDACEKNASSTVPFCQAEVVVRGKPHLAKWLPDATSNLAPEQFARLVSFELATEHAAVVDFGELGGGGGGCQTSNAAAGEKGQLINNAEDDNVLSATEQLRQRQRAHKETLLDDHSRLVAAEHKAQAERGFVRRRADHKRQP